MINWIAGPWIWDATNASEPYWRSPAGFSGLDCRTLAEQSQAGGTPGLGIFVGQVPLASIENRSDYGVIGQGSWYDAKPNAIQKSRIPCRKGFNPGGDDLVGMILSAFTDGASPDGSDGPKPLVPTVGGKLELCFGQKHVERFRWGGFHTAVLKQQMRAEFAAMWRDAQGGKMRDTQHPRRVVDYWCEKLGVDDWREFVPLTLQKDIAGRLPHETTINDTFNRANAGSLGTSSDGTWSWSAHGSFGTSIVSNKAQPNGGGESVGRADADLSSADHYAQAAFDVAASTFVGPVCRFDASVSNTYYHFRKWSGAGPLQLYKRVSGTFTQLGSDVSDSTSPPLTLKVESNGTTITGYLDGVSKISQTDSGISGNLRTGFRDNASLGADTFDNFQAADLAASGILYTQLERSTRGICRGIYTRWG